MSECFYSRFKLQFAVVIDVFKLSSVPGTSAFFSVNYSTAPIELFHYLHYFFHTVKDDGRRPAGNDNHTSAITDVVLSACNRLLQPGA